MALTITVGGNDITSKVQIESLRIEQSAERMVATASFQVTDSGATVSIAAKDAVVIADGATTYFKGEVAGASEEQEVAPNKLIWYVDCQDYNQLMNERVEEDYHSAAGTADNVIIASIFYDKISGLDFTTYVDAIEADMPAMDFEAMTLAECIADISAITGGRYYIDFDLYLHYYADAGVTASDGLSDSPDDVSTFRYWALRKLADVGIINRVYIKGAGVTGWVDDSPSMATYGNREMALRDSTVVSSSGLALVGQAILNTNKDPNETYSLRTLHGGYTAGDKVELTSSVFSLSAEAFIVLRITTTFLNGTTPVFELYIGDELANAQQRWKQDQDSDRDPSQMAATIILYDSSQTALQDYAATSAGLDSASGDAQSGDVILIPAVRIGDNHVLADDANYIGIDRWGTVLTGKITSGSNTTVANLTIDRDETEHDYDIIGLDGPITGTLKVLNCEIDCDNGGSADAIALRVHGNGDVCCYYSKFNATSTSGSGYGAKHEEYGGGDLYLYFCEADGSTTDVHLET